MSRASRSSGRIGRRFAALAPLLAAPAIVASVPLTLAGCGGGEPEPGYETPPLEPEESDEE